MAKSLVAGSWEAFGWQLGWCAEPKLAQVVAGASAEMKYQFICSPECLCGHKVSVALTLGELTVVFGAQLLRNGMALRVMTSTDYQIGRFEVAAMIDCKRLCLRHPCCLCCSKPVTTGGICIGPPKKNPDTCGYNS